jgi:hypothetical protein
LLACIDNPRLLHASTQLRQLPDPSVVLATAAGTVDYHCRQNPWPIVPME